MWLQAGVIGAIALLAAPATVHGAKADLAVTTVTGAPASAATGDTVVLKATVRNEGRGRSNPAKLFAQVVGEAGGAIGGQLGRETVAALDPGKKRKVTLRPKIPFEAVGEWLLSVCVAPGKAPNDCAETDLIDIGDGSSEGLIEAARAAGELTEGEALLYRLYAMRRDDLLPSEYDGGGPSSSGVVMSDLIGAYATLPTADQEALIPYLLQPRYAESAWAPGGTSKARLDPGGLARGANPCADLDTLNGAWSGVESANAYVWYPPGNQAVKAKAERLSAEFEAKIWPKLTGAFKVVDDAAAAPCDPAGNPKIDVYLAAGNSILAGRGGVAPGLHVGADCGPKPSFVIIPSNATRSTLAHEFMHVIQWAYPVCDRDPAWVEGIAAWAEDFVYKRDQAEHQWDKSIATPFVGMRKSGDLEWGYNAWAFWYAMHKNHGLDGIKRVFAGLAGGNFPSALELGAPDGLEEEWKRYAVLRWNQTPIGKPGFPPKSLSRWDGLSVKPVGVPSENVALGGLPEKLFPLQTSNQEPLSTWFHRVKITDPQVRELEFTNADAETAGTAVQAFLKLDNGNWRLEDWSDQDEVTLCRDKPDENVVEMVVATSNALPAGNPLGVVNHQLRAKDICEPPTYTGTYSGTSRFTGPGADWTTNFDGTLTLAPYDGPNATGREWEITGGTLDVTSFDGEIEPCSVSGGGQTFGFPAFNQANAPAMVLTGGRYYLNIPWVFYSPPQSLTVAWSGPPGEDCEEADPEYPIHGIGQVLTLTPNGVTPAEDGTLAVSDVSSSGDPNWEHDGFEFTLVPLP
jgi:hypothetical protein